VCEVTAGACERNVVAYRLDKLLPNVGERLPQEVVRVEEAATAVLLMFARVAVAQVGMVG